MAKVKPVAIKTPLGELTWVTHSGEGKENLNGVMKYVADLVLDKDSPECKELVAKLDAFWKENKPTSYRGKPKTRGYRPEMRKVLDADGNETYDEDDAVIKEPTGRIVFPFTTDTTYPSGDPKVISIFNAKGNKVNLGQKKIGNGSMGNIGGSMGLYDRDDGKGVSLFLNSIRLTKFVEFTNEESWDDAGVDEGWTGEDNWDAEDDEATESEPKKAAPRL